VESYGTAITAERKEILSGFVCCSFTFIVSVGVVDRFLEICVAFARPLEYLFAALKSVVKHSD